MSIEYKLVPTKNNKSRIVTRYDEGNVVTTHLKGREDNAAFALQSSPTGQRLYIRVPRADGTGLDEVELNGRQLRTLRRIFDRHENG
jgi:hypothetical protein